MKNSKTGYWFYGLFWAALLGLAWFFFNASRAERHWYVVYAYETKAGQSGTGRTALVTTGKAFPPLEAESYILQKAAPDFTKVAIVSWKEMSDDEWTEMTTWKPAPRPTPSAAPAHTK